MKKLLLLAVCAAALFAAVPSQAECASVGSIYACEDQYPADQGMCHYSGLAVTGHSGCVWYGEQSSWAIVSGPAHEIQYNIWSGGAAAGSADLAGACVYGYVATSPDADAGLC